MNSLDFRRDKRTVEEFANDVEDFTEREAYWGVILRHDFIEKGKFCCLEDYGVDNSGKIILGRLPNINVDKVFHFANGKKKFIEIKTIPEGVKKFFTFKASSLLSCVEQNAYIIVPRSCSYYVLPPDICDYFYKNYTHEVYSNFAFGKKAVRIYMNDIEKLIKENKIIRKEWSSGSKKLINKNYNVLFRQRG